MGKVIFVSRREAEETTLNEALNRFLDEFEAGYANPKQTRSRVGCSGSYEAVSICSDSSS